MVQDTSIFVEESVIFTLALKIQGDLNLALISG
jgi:hypothetical protein